MSYAITKKTESSLIPGIDPGPLRDGANPHGVARGIHKTSRDVGFIYVSNHGILDAMIERTRCAPLDFFRAPAERKREVEVSAKHRGFLKAGGPVAQRFVPWDHRR